MPDGARHRRGALAALTLGVLLWACGDAPSADPRGYTKSPLEQPGLTVEPEATTEMAELGAPTLPVAPTTPPDSAAG